MSRKPSRKPKRTRTRRVPKKTRKPVKTAKRDTLDDVISASAKSLGLKIEQAWLLAVRTHLQVTLQHGARVASFALPDDSEPAPVFEA